MQDLQDILQELQDFPGIAGLCRNRRTLQDCGSPGAGFKGILTYAYYKTNIYI